MTTLNSSDFQGRILVLNEARPQKNVVCLVSENHRTGFDARWLNPISSTPRQQSVIEQKPSTGSEKPPRIESGSLDLYNPS